LVACGLLTAGVSISAHHSFAAEFDSTKKVKLTGIVTKVEWTNPHAWFYVNVKEFCTGTPGATPQQTTWKCAPPSEVQNWGAELGPPHGLQRRGWRRETLKIGEEITVEGSLAKNGAKRMNASTVTLTSTGGRPGETLDAASSQGGAVID